MNSTLLVALAALFAGSGSMLMRAQTSDASGAATLTVNRLIDEPLGDTADPKVSIINLPIRPGLTAGPHTHKGPVFAYIVQGDIENQVDPDPAKIYHPGDFFFEPQMHVHRMLRNMSNTEPAKIIVFEVGDIGKTSTLFQAPAEIANREGHMLTLSLPPGATPSGAHKHPGPVFAYIVKGEIENQVEPDEPKVYHAGDVFYEPPMHAHQLLRNLSKTEPALVVVFEVTGKGEPLTVGAGH